MENDFWRITLDTNPEDCNLACIMCEEHSPYSQFKQRLRKSTQEKVRRMPPEWLRPLFEQAVALGVREIIPSTMGEPLMYKEFDQILSLCAEYGIACNLTTNGSFPGRSVEEWAEAIIPVTSDVKISWNGATKKTAEAVMLKIDFDKAIDNVRRFIAVRDRIHALGGNFCRVSFQLTYMRMNMDELPEIIRLAAGLGVDRVKGHHLWDHFEEIKGESFRQNPDTIRRWNALVEAAHAEAEQARKPDGSKVVLEQITALDLVETQSVPEHYDCPFLGKELWVSARGRISPCCAPDELRQGLGDFGTYPETALTEVGDSPAYQQLMRDYKTRPLCQHCNMRKPAPVHTQNSARS